MASLQEGQSRAGAGQLATKKRWAEFHKARKPVAKAKAKPRAAAKKAPAPEGMTATAAV
jgi:hypothetical protein